MIAKDIKILLDDLGQVNTGDYGDIPDNLITLYESGGYSPEVTKLGMNYEHPTLQVRVRNLKYAEGIGICEQIKNRLAFVNNIVLNGNTYKTIRQQGDILPLGKDNKYRSEFSINFEIKVRR